MYMYFVFCKKALEKFEIHNKHRIIFFAGNKVRPDMINGEKIVAGGWVGAVMQLGRGIMRVSRSRNTLKIAISADSASSEFSCYGSFFLRRDTFL